MQHQQQTGFFTSFSFFFHQRCAGFDFIAVLASLGVYSQLRFALRTRGPTWPLSFKKILKSNYSSKKLNKDSQ